MACAADGCMEALSVSGRPEASAGNGDRPDQHAGGQPPTETEAAFTHRADQRIPVAQHPDLAALQQTELPQPVRLAALDLTNVVNLELLAGSGGGQGQAHPTHRMVRMNTALPDRPCLFRAVPVSATMTVPVAKSAGRRRVRTMHVMTPLLKPEFWVHRGNGSVPDTSHPGLFSDGSRSICTPTRWNHLGSAAQSSKLTETQSPNILILLLEQVCQAIFSDNSNSYGLKGLNA